ncbi:MAG TPA: hypothetical protein VEK84_06410, partial [Terriglobales bacterium]|nr:hypothetical protein [Terriglobales bacterium]
MAESVGPRELAQVVIKERSDAVVNGRRSGSISNARLEELIGIAYSASLMREEGTFLRSQLHALADAEPGYGTRVLHFSMPIALTSADVVRKLASAAPLEGRGLVVEEREQRLWVVGILESRWDYHVAAVGMASLSASPGSKGTTVAILGPGRIAVYDCFPALELRAGQI